MRPSLLLLVAAAAAATVACGSNRDGDDRAPGGPADGEPADEAALEAHSDADETGLAALAAAPLEGARDFVDVRGVGDSGGSRTHVSPAPAFDYGAALDHYDATGASYRGDLTFINWETTIADSCATFSKPYEAGRSYAFISRASSLASALDRGFNLVGLANNHSRDCTRTGDGLDGLDSTRAAVGQLARPDRLFHGVTADDAKQKPAIGTFHIKGRTVKVALASVYLGIGSGAKITAKGDADAVMQATQRADVDLRILALHSVDAGNQAELSRVAEAFVTRYGGDVVFGSGPHVWAPVRVLRKPNGKAGVVFESTGNFLHPGLGIQDKNYIGRALFDPATLRLAQVQLIAVKNTGDSLERSMKDPTAVPANLSWRPGPSSGFRTVFANVKE